MWRECKLWLIILYRLICGFPRITLGGLVKYSIGCPFPNSQAVRDHFQPIDVLTLLQEFVLQKHLSKPTFDKMNAYAQKKCLFYSEKVHEDISNLAERLYEISELNDFNAC